MNPFFNNFVTDEEEAEERKRKLREAGLAQQFDAPSPQIEQSREMPFNFGQMAQPQPARPSLNGMASILGKPDDESMIDKFIVGNLSKNGLNTPSQMATSRLADMLGGQFNQQTGTIDRPSKGRVAMMFLSEMLRGAASNGKHEPIFEKMQREAELERKAMMDNVQKGLAVRNSQLTEQKYNTQSQQMQAMLAEKQAEHERRAQEQQQKIALAEKKQLADAWFKESLIGVKDRTADGLIDLNKSKQKLLEIEATAREKFGNLMPKDLPNRAAYFLQLQGVTPDDPEYDKKYRTMVNSLAQDEHARAPKPLSASSGAGKGGKKNPLIAYDDGEINEKQALQLYRINNELDKLSVDYRKVKDMYGAMYEAASNKGGPADEVILRQFARLMDPHTGVRDAERQMMANAAGVAMDTQTLLDDPWGWIKGRKLTPEARRAILQASHNVYKSHHDIFSKAAEPQLRMADAMFQNPTFRQYLNTPSELMGLPEISDTAPTGPSRRSNLQVNMPPKTAVAPAAKEAGGAAPDFKSDLDAIYERITNKKKR